MDARTVLGAGAGLSVLGALLLITGGSDLRVAASLCAVLGLLALAFSIWALTGEERPGALLLGGAALFLLGRLAQILLRIGDDATFAALTVVNALGTVLLFAGVWRSVRERLKEAPHATPKPVPNTAPTAAPALRASSIKPAQPVRTASPPKRPGQSS
ncbi:MAG: hypothetical protein LC624_10280 [Halobacteriales archaeon]|nr:hypothetical protein [Halobacteriales archaeon]